MRAVILLVFICLGFAAGAQYAPQVSVAGSTAIAAASGNFVGWATHCDVARGYRDIALPDSGYVTGGSAENAIGAADVSIVSLGDSGVAVLTFAAPIYDGPGADFAVFENGFANPADPTMAFLELAFVEVSSDGVNFFRFPATSYTEDTFQVPGAGVYMDATKINNLAGKYIANYGTPFDLSELAGIAGLDIMNVTHVRIIDVVGALGGHACTDTGGRVINDPYPTNFATGGFDLDGVGVIHQVGNTGVSTVNINEAVRVYPNPATDKITIAFKNTTAGTMSVLLTDETGRAVYASTTLLSSIDIPMATCSRGVYYLTMHDTNGGRWVQKVTKL